MVASEHLYIEDITRETRMVIPIPASAALSVAEISEAISLLTTRVEAGLIGHHWFLNVGSQDLNFNQKVRPWIIEQPLLRKSRTN
jgi:hypothetical protein